MTEIEDTAGIRCRCPRTDCEHSAPLPNEKTVDLAELTRRLGEPDHRQPLVADFADSSGPWTEDEADIVHRAWINADDDQDCC
jgi:hypothetical protein